MTGATCSLHLRQHIAALQRSPLQGAGAARGGSTAGMVWHAPAGRRKAANDEQRRRQWQCRQHVCRPGAPGVVGMVRHSTAQHGMMMQACLSGRRQWRVTHHVPPPSPPAAPGIPNRQYVPAGIQEVPTTGGGSRGWPPKGCVATGEVPSPHPTQCGESTGQPEAGSLTNTNLHGLVLHTHLVLVCAVGSTVSGVSLQLCRRSGRMHGAPDEAGQCALAE